MARILLTGASGFVGNNLARYLLNEGHGVSILVRPDHTSWRLVDLLPHVQVRTADLCDPEAVNAAVREARPEWVFHLAAHGAYSFQSDPLAILQTNIIGAANLLEACLRTGFDAFVNTGSSSEYGFQDHPPVETEQIEPNSHYAVAKASATMLCRYLARSRKARITTLRLYSVYGPYEEPARLIPTVIVRGLGNRLPLLVNPLVARDFVYVGDVVRAYVLAATTHDQEPGAVYNVGTGVQTSIGDAVETARSILNITDQPQWSSMPDRIWDTGTWVSDSRSIREKLGWEPRFGFREGFASTVQWFRDHPNLTNFYREKLEQVRQGS